MKIKAHRATGASSIANHTPRTQLHAHVPPVFQTSTFSFENVDAAKAAFTGDDTQSYVYSRGRNPNAEDLARKIAWLEARELMTQAKTDNVDNVAAARIYSSGMGAICAAVLSHVENGDIALVQGSLYSGSYNLWNEICPKFGIRAKTIQSFEPADWQKAFEENPEAKIAYIETPSNPTMQVHDIKALAQIAHSFGARLIVDNTFATPIHQLPLTHGADLVVHSLTKFISGHGAVVAGAVVSRHPEEMQLFSDFWNLSIELGACPSPMDCWITDMGLKTLELRMHQHSQTAQKIAEYLQDHPKIKSIAYPGLKQHPHHERAAKQMQNGFGGLMTFELNSDLNGAKRFLDALRIPSLAISLGSVDSLIQCPALMTHSNMSAESRKAAGISDSMIRLSVGIENTEDLMQDFQIALDAI